jgi:hypothetical protein
MLELMLISEPERDLLDAIAEVGYGELLCVEVKDAPQKINRRVPDHCRKLLELIRNGCPYIESIKVHDRYPTQVLISGETRQLKYLKKIQL